MSGFRVWQYRVSRRLGRFITRTAAVLTLGRMPPFVSASTLLVEDGLVLVVHDPVRREPVLPGGHLKWREAPQQAMVREAREETGYDVRPDRLLMVCAGDALAGEPGIVRIIFAGTRIGGALASSGEGQPGWLPVEEYARSTYRDAPIVRQWVQDASATGSLR